MLQFKKKEEPDVKVEGCRTYEEDYDDILLSRSLGKSIFVGSFNEHVSIF